jgi:hypothetical protein
MLKRVIVGHFQRHPRITANHAEHQKKKNREGAKSAVYEAVRDVDALEAPVQRVRQNENKVVLLQISSLLDDIFRISRAANTCDYRALPTPPKRDKLLNL